MARNNFNLPALVSDLPPEAIRSDTLLITLNLEWLEGAVLEDQYKAMKAWFLARYCDPSDTTPYSQLEGKYIFVHGGPFRPDDILFKEFGVLAKDEVIQELASDLERAVGSEWVPVNPTNSEGELRFAQDVYYDERFGFYVPDPQKPFSDLEQRLEEIGELLTLSGTQSGAQLARRVAYSATITALETYLWERLTYAVENDVLALENIVANVQYFKECNIRLSDIFDKHRNIGETVKGYLQSIVWHRWDKVSPLITHGLGIKAPSFKPFVEPLIKRHDIVHRSGHTQHGKVIFVTIEEVRQLTTAVKLFAQKMEDLIRQRDEFDFNF